MKVILQNQFETYLWAAECGGRIHCNNDDHSTIRLGVAIERPFAHARARFGIRFRLTDDVKLKTFTLGAWFGGDSIAPKNQKVFDDNVAIGTSFLP